MNDNNKLGNKSEARKKLRRLCVAAAFAAMICVATGFLPGVPVGTGYVHCGDAVIFVCAALLPVGYAAPAAAIGASLADVFAGYAAYVPATFVIKALTVLAFSHGKGKMISRRNLAACAIAAPICVGGYFLWEALVFSSLVAPLASVIGNLIQSVGSSVLFFAFSFIADKTGLSHKLK